MKFEFGTILSMDYEPHLRAMVLAKFVSSVFARETWNAIVLRDTPGLTGSQWPVGAIISVSPETSGIVVVEEASWTTR